jgi:hypothetical protein
MAIGIPYPSPVCRHGCEPGDRRIPASFVPKGRSARHRSADFDEKAD